MEAIYTSKNFFRKVNAHIAEEDLEILENLEILKQELNHLHNSIDYLTEPLLIDSCIYEIQSLNMRYQFYMQLCRQRGLAADWGDL